jgi:hypothetical protein
MSVMGLGCVKTPKLKFQIENSSRLRLFEKQKLGKHCWEKTIKKTIPRAPRAQTFLLSLGQQQPICDGRATSAYSPEATELLSAEHQYPGVDRPEPGSSSHIADRAAPR